jgi:molybdate transport system substrate-binding protein
MRLIMLALAAALATAQAAEAAEIRVVGSNAIRTVLEAAGPAFEKQSGHKVGLGFGTSAQLTKRIQSGERTDAVFITPETIDQLTQQGLTVKDARVTIARSLVGVAVRTGSPHPDISTPDAFRRALLAAKTVTFSDPATGATNGVHTAKLLERLGIAAEMKPKLKLGDGSSTGPWVASGEAELAVQQISALKPVAGIDIVGPLPAELQLVTVLDAAIAANVQDVAVVKEFIVFLRTPDGAAIIRAKGLEPN